MQEVLEGLEGLVKQELVWVQIWVQDEQGELEQVLEWVLWGLESVQERHE